MSPISRKIPLAVVISIALGAVPFSVSAATSPARTAQSSYFELRYGKDQEKTLITALPLDVLPPASQRLDRVDSVPLKTILQYDTQLPYVSYKTQSATEFHRRLEGQIAQTLAKKKFVKEQLTPSQLVIVVGEIVVATMKYDYRMVSKDKRYSLKYDDYISELPLDQVFLTEKSGVCRQYAALFEYVAEYLRDTSKSPYLAGVVVDEMISYEYNHAYNVIFLPQADGTLVVSFIDPVAMRAGEIIKTGNALNVTHDALFAEFIKGKRWNWSADERVAILKKLKDFKQQGERSVAQVEKELAAIKTSGVRLAAAR